ncbi:hypothetical protein DFQ28_003728 [Apophysomyces sp. BC1034]|nr:hypothetical protein DFQ30_009154 [Apophysomyces sp. BC1015]KAG0180538.1 hypothetical protein DFQ29_000491 [Apophysomyces sp. BC1021]KAG0189210.1 hypothetical protein DFQ28_003728 [Apophysomyces sp. BC1034]
MPEATARAGTTPNAGRDEREKGFFEKYGGQIMQMLVMWIAMQFFFGNGFFQKQPQAPAPAVSTETSGVPLPTAAVSFTPELPKGVYYGPLPEIPLTELPDTFVPLWQAGTPMDLSVYVSEAEYFVDYHIAPVWRSTDIVLGDSSFRREHHVEIPTNSYLQNNGSLYAHIFLTRKEMPINPEDPSFIPDAVVYHRHPLTKYYPKKAVVKQKNLLQQGEQEEEAEIEQEPVIAETAADESTGGFGLGLLGKSAPLVSYWHDNVTIAIVSDAKNVIPKNALQPPVIKYIPFDTGLTRDETGKVGYYRPIVFPNDFWLLRQNAYPVNETVSTLPLTIHLEPISMWKFNIYAMFDESMKQQASNPLGGMSSSEMDEVKRMFLETNPILLGTTVLVSLLHSVFEMLAFKNGKTYGSKVWPDWGILDIAFWKKKDNSAGVSVRSILVNIFFQIVIFLYLMDNNQETSWMILIGQGVGLLIEVWKVFKALKYELVWMPGSILPTLRTQTTETTAEEDDTAKYDAIAFKYLTWVSYPLLGGYAIYSLLYDEHKSWYSYVLKTLVEFVYMFGFLTMLPQLFINYRLKSVAHMPWRTLMYKSLNTFIDDLFAFVIKMPTLHRLACLRDDVVFLIYLYQRYVYRVDPTRANEYGQVGQAQEQEGEKEESKKTK